MKILITGARGFIGQHLIPALAREFAGAEVFALSRQAGPVPGASPMEGDVLDKAMLEGLFRRVSFDVVVHLAAITEHCAIVDHKIQTFHTNLNGTANLLSCFNTYCKGGLFLYTSTGKIYGKTQTLPITEETVPAPQNILGKTKRITEQVIDLYAIPGNQYLICRIFNIYGEHQKRNFVVPTIIDQLGQPALDLGSLTDKRDYLYIADLIHALTGCIRSRERFEPVDYVNIGSGQPVSVSDILREMERLLGRKLAVRTRSERLRHDEMPVEYCSHQKLTARTGWEPAFSLRKGLQETLKKEGVLP